MFAMSDLEGALPSFDKCKDCNDFCQQACDLISSLVLNYGSPLEAKSPDIPHACAACPQSFTSDVQLRDHVRREHKETLNFVPLDTLYELLGHRAEEKNTSASRVKKRRYPCTSCKKRYKSRRKLARHVRHSHAAAPDKTKGSHKSSESHRSRKDPGSSKPPKKDSRQQGKFVHTNGSTRRLDGNAGKTVSSAQVSYLCEVCGRTDAFSENSSRLDSKSCSCRTVSKSREDKDTGFQSKSRREPRKSSSGDKAPSKEPKHRCTICKKLFKNKKGLAIHMGWERRGMRKSSTKIPRKTPSVANDERQSGESLTGFVWAHQEEVEVDAGRKSHKCSECDRSFDTSRAVLMHFRHMHERDDSEQSYESEDGLYHCRRCKVTCLTKDDMLLHGLQHRTCTRCDKTFQSVATLKMHVRRMHGFKRGDGIFLYKCSGCSASFRSKKTLTLHRVMTGHPAGRLVKVVDRSPSHTETSQDIRAEDEELKKLEGGNISGDDDWVSKRMQEDDSTITEYDHVDSKAWYW